MSVRLMVLLVIAALAAAVLVSDLGHRDAPALLPPRARVQRPARPAPLPAGAITRNVFEYGPRPLPVVSTRPLPVPSDATPTSMAAEPVVRLVGLVRRRGVTKAVLKVRGETMEVAAGEAAGGYRVVAIDDDAVRLVAPDGTAVTLTAGGE
jgi:hypothetical protein